MKDSCGFRILLSIFLNDLLDLRGLDDRICIDCCTLARGAAVCFPFSKFAVRFVCLLDDLLCFLPRKAVLRFQLQLLEFAVLLVGIQSLGGFSLRGS